MDLFYLFLLSWVIDINGWSINVGLTVNSTVTQPECAVSVMYHSLAVLTAPGRATELSWEAIYTLKSSKEPPEESGSRKIVKRMLVYCFIIFIALKAESFCLLRWKRMFCVLHKEAPKQDRRQHIFLLRKGCAVAHPEWASTLGQEVHVGCLLTRVVTVPPTDGSWASVCHLATL